MKIWVGVTDKGWYQHLARVVPDEVNFWQPSGSRSFRALQPGEPFLFKLHSPDNFIVGGGYFVRHSPLPASLAWEAFGIKNGVTSFDDLVARIRRYRQGEAALDPMIGCNVLAEPFFLSEREWVPIPQSWAANIVQGKTYDSDSIDGARLWESVRNAASAGDARQAMPPDSQLDAPRFGTEYLTRGRLGQGSFRVLVTDAYARRCAISGEKTLPVLEAAHIMPYARNGPHAVRNGLLLRSDLHKLFDLGYVTVTPNLRVQVSSRLRAEWENGRDYYAFHGRELACRPLETAKMPATSFLSWHNENTFKG
jgi:putative restriction endonuclease